MWPSYGTYCIVLVCKFFSDRWSSRQADSLEEQGIRIRLYVCMCVCPHILPDLKCDIKDRIVSSLFK